MSKERGEQNSEARLPVDVNEQLALLPGMEARLEICGDLAQRIVKLLGHNGIQVEDAIVRAKKREKIERKIEIRGSTAPQRDHYGIRLVTKFPDRQMIARIIQDEFPGTPAVFPDGMPSIRDYADKSTRDFVRATLNPRISERHSALHVNFVFLREGKNVYDIAEVQVLTPEEMEIFRQTRNEYENGKH